MCTPAFMSPRHSPPPPLPSFPTRRSSDLRPPTPDVYRGARPHVSGVAPHPEGITNPPIDELLERTSSKYGLVIFAAKRARQINAYYSQLSEGLLEYVGPLVDTAPQEKPLSIALREINEGLLTHTAGEN